MPTLWLPRGQKPAPGQIVEWSAYTPALPRPVGEWWLNEGCGALVNDASGNLNHGTMVGAPAWTPTTRGTGLSFDGTSDYALFGQSSLCKLGNLGAPFTVMCRVMFPAFEGGTSHYQFFSCTNVNLTNGWALTYRNSATTPNVELSIASTAYIARGQTSSTIATGTGYAIVGTYDGNACKVYFDGQLQPLGVDTRGSGTTNNTLQLAFATSEEGAGSELVLQAATLSVHASALTAKQVEALQGPVPIWVPQRYFDLGAPPVGIITPRRFNPGLWTPGTNPGVM